MVNDRPRAPTRMVSIHLPPGIVADTDIPIANYVDDWKGAVCLTQVCQLYGDALTPFGAANLKIIKRDVAFSGPPPQPEVKLMDNDNIRLGYDTNPVEVLQITFVPFDFDLPLDNIYDTP